MQLRRRDWPAMARLMTLTCALIDVRPAIALQLSQSGAHGHLIGQYVEPECSGYRCHPSVVVKPRPARMVCAGCSICFHLIFMDLSGPLPHPPSTICAHALSASSVKHTRQLQQSPGCCAAVSPGMICIGGMLG